MKRLVYKGRFTGLDCLPQREHPKNSVAFKEPQSMKELARLANIIAIALYVLLLIVYILRAGGLYFSILAFICALLCAVPHEFLHAVCLKGEVQLYQNLKQGMLFVTSTEDMTRRGFVLMSLFPNLVFGIVPFILFLLEPSWIFLGSLGFIAIPMGAGDYMNVCNALTQVPKNASVYMSGMNTFWYIPEEI